MGIRAPVNHSEIPQRKNSRMRLASLVPSGIRKRRWERKTTARYAAALAAGHEPEAVFLPQLCDRARVSIDVGANLGGYTLLLRKHSARVVAYEPNPHLAARLERVFRRSRSVEVRRCALSDKPGVARMRIPSDHGRSTIEASNDIGGREASLVDVETRRLDEEALVDVGFIKIDVEGHELAVLRGAGGLLRACGPALLIEASDEHRPDALASIRAFLEPLGYRGYVADNGGKRSVEPSDASLQNFIFQA
jgi:FkbM family methyltransferase